MSDAMKERVVEIIQPESFPHSIISRPKPNPSSTHVKHITNLQFRL